MCLPTTIITSPLNTPSCPSLIFLTPNLTRCSIGLMIEKEMERLTLRCASTLTPSSILSRAITWVLTSGTRRSRWPATWEVTNGLNGDAFLRSRTLETSLQLLTGLRSLRNYRMQALWPDWPACYLETCSVPGLSLTIASEAFII